MSYKNLQEYYRNYLLKQVKTYAEKHGESQNISFINFLDKEFIDPITGIDGFAYSHVSSSDNKFQVEGYASENDFVNNYFLVTDFTPSNDVKNISTDISKKLFFKCENFISLIYSKTYSKILKTVSNNQKFSEFCYKANCYKGDTQTITIFLITNKTKDKGFKIQQSKKIGSIVLDFRIIDLTDLFQRYQELSAFTESIECISFSDNKEDLISAIKLNAVSDTVDGYMVFFPAKILVALYDKHSKALLQSNVRYYLNAQGKNKGIIETIEERKELFFAYNNGISATVSHIETNPPFCSGEIQNCVIKKLFNFQIVNGGQTTASIHYAWKVNQLDVSGIYVPMKITHIKSKNEYAAIERNISKYSNKQNTVKDSDLESNNPFFVDFQNIANELVTESGTTWFFERKPGEWNIQLLKTDIGEQRDAFLKIFPKNKKITKVELARYLMAFGITKDDSGVLIQNPDYAGKGAEKNFEKFGRLKKEIPVLDIQFIKDSVAKTILFIETDRIVSALKLGQQKQHIVNYTIAFLSFKTIGNIDFELIWSKQSLSTQLARELKKMAKILWRDGINYPSNSKSNIATKNIGEWAKRPDCWEFIKQNIKYKLPKGIPECSLKKQKGDQKKKQAKREINFNQEVVFIKKLKKQDLKGEIFIPKKYLIPNINGFFPNPILIDPKPKGKESHCVSVSINGSDFDIYTFRQEFHQNNDTRFKTPISQLFIGHERSLSTIIKFVRLGDKKYSFQILNSINPDYEKFKSFLEVDDYYTNIES